MAHESPRTAKLYDRTADVITLDKEKRNWSCFKAQLVARASTQNHVDTKRNLLPPDGV